MGGPDTARKAPGNVGTGDVFQTTPMGTMGVGFTPGAPTHGTPVAHGLGGIIAGHQQQTTSPAVTSTKARPSALTAVGGQLNKYDSAETEEILAVQKAGATVEEIKATLLQAKSPLFVLFVSGKKSTKIHLAHSLARCPRDRVPLSSELGNRVVGFGVTSNTPLLFPSQSTWERKEVVLPNGVEAVKEQEGVSPPKVGSLKEGTKVILPRILLVPTCLAEIVYGWITKGYTCIQGYVELCELFPPEEKFKSIKDWLLAASQEGTGEDSQLRLPVAATDEAEEQFQEWCEE
eukprot:scaffold19640_cov250-Skeletonema_marinoi.AAC.1